MPRDGKDERWPAASRGAGIVSESSRLSDGALNVEAINFLGGQIRVVVALDAKVNGWDQHI